MTKKTVKKKIDDCEVEVEYEDGEVKEVNIHGDSILGKIKNRSHICGDHLDVVRRLVQDGFPK